MSNLENDVGSDMDDKLGHEKILKILSSMPEQASPHEVTALITNIILAYNLQGEWYMIAHMTHDTLNEIANMNGYSTIH